MVISISTAKLVCMVIVSILGFLLPLGGMFFWWRKKQASWLPFLLGFSAYIFGVLICQQIVGGLLFQKESFQAYLQEHIWVLILISGLQYCVFEEGTKYLAFFCMRKMNTKEVSISFGLGFAALPAIFSVGMQILYTAFMLSNVRGKTIEQAVAELGITEQSGIDSFTELIQYSMNTETYLFALNGLEAIALFLVEAFLAVFVFKAIQERKIIYLVIAMSLRFVYNSISCLYTYGMITNEFLAEILLVLFGIAVAYAGLKVYRNMHLPEKEIEDAMKEKEFAYHKDNSGKSLRNIASISKRKAYVSEEEQEAAFQEAMQEGKRDS